MAISTRLVPIDRDVRVMLDSAMGPEARAMALRGHAKRSLAEGQTLNRSILGYTPPHVISVDGRLGAPIDSAGPNSMIIIEFELLLDLFRWIHAELVSRSPVGSGDDPRPRHPGLYRESHVFLADGAQIPIGAEPPPASEYVFANTQPYARRIERGWSDQVIKVYENVAKAADRRYGNVARIRFGYKSITDVSDLDSWASRSTLQKKGRKGPRRMTVAQREEWLRAQPAVIITLRDR